MHIMHDVEVFDVRGYEQQNLVGDEVNRASDIARLLQNPIYAVNRALSIVHLNTGRTELTLMHMLQDRETMLYFVKLSTHLYTEVGVINGRRYMSKANLIEHERSKAGLITQLAQRAYSTQWIDKPVADEQGVMHVNEPTDATMRSPEERMMLRCCGLTLNLPNLHGVREAMDEVGHREPPRGRTLKEFDREMLVFHLASLTYSRNEMMFNRVHLPSHILQFTNLQYNQLMAYLQRAAFE